MAGCVQIWNMKSAEWKKTLSGHTGRIRCLSLNNYQRTKRIISGSDDKTINIWDSVAGVCLTTLQGHTSGVLSFATNENYFISSSRDQTIRGWDLETGRCTLLLRGHTGAVRSIDLLGHRLVSGSEDRLLGEWDLRDKLCIQTIRGHTASVGAVLYCPNNLVVSGSHDTTVRLWDFRYSSNSTNNSTYSTSYSNSSSGSNSSSNISSSSSCSGICLPSSSSSQQLLNILNGHTMWVQTIACNGKRLVTGSGDHTIKLWDLGQNTCLRTYSDHYGYPIGDLYTDGIKMVSGDWRGQVRIWNFAGLKW